jgi:hypothetical protein
MLIKNGCIFKTYKGINIYGTPYSLCRKETQGKKYLSDAFERTREQRKTLYQKIPKGKKFFVCVFCYVYKND